MEEKSLKSIIFQLEVILNDNVPSILVGVPGCHSEMEDSTGLYYMAAENAKFLQCTGQLFTMNCPT